MLRKVGRRQDAKQTDIGERTPRIVAVSVQLKPRVSSSVRRSVASSRLAALKPDYHDPCPVFAGASARSRARQGYDETSGRGAVLATGTSAWAGDPGKVSKPVVTVCMDPGANPINVSTKGRAEATQLLKQADVRIEWRNDERACTTAEHGIVVSVSLATPEDLYPGALAYAFPFERTRIVLLYDRVLNALGPAEGRVSWDTCWRMRSSTSSKPSTSTHRLAS